MRGNAMNVPASRPEDPPRPISNSPPEKGTVDDLQPYRPQTTPAHPGKRRVLGVGGRPHPAHSPMQRLRQVGSPDPTDLQPVRLANHQDGADIGKGTDPRLHDQ